ncbi:MAG: hypothetical protein OEQ53_04425 [Saprospiraceae bacterium]|nr:hypothetical protein [Saprospiraceae bacterium]
MGQQVHTPAFVTQTYFENTTVVSDFYAFDPTHSSGNQWSLMDDFPEGFDAAVGFSIRSKGYVITKLEDSDIKRVWQFDPDADKGQQWQSLPNFSAAIDGNPEVAAVIGKKAFLYFNANLNNFWMYVPELEMP